MCTDIITSEHLIFRPMTREDTDLVLKWRNSENVRCNFLYRKDITRDQHLARFDREIETGKIIQFIITEKTGGTPVGSVYLRNVDPVKKCAEYGVFIGEDDARGRGYGSETAVRIVEYFFNEMKYERLYLRVLEDNTPAIKSYERAGFRVVDKSKIGEGDAEDGVIFMMVIR